jgi:hypothetical protein
MALPGCSISVGVDGTNAFLRLAGRAAVERGPSFERAVLQLQAGGVRRIVLDLSAILLMDSGFTGTIAGLIRRSGLAFVLHRAPQRILDGFADHGVLELVGQLDEEGACTLPEAAGEEGLQAGSRSEVLRCCLDAHRALMALKPENVAKFQAVEQFLAQELAKDPGPVA